MKYRTSSEWPIHVNRHVLKEKVFLEISKKIFVKFLRTHFFTEHFRETASVQTISQYFHLSSAFYLFLCIFWLNPLMCNIQKWLFKNTL